LESGINTHLALIGKKSKMYIDKFLNFLSRFLREKKLLILDICIVVCIFVFLSKMISSTPFLCEPTKTIYQIESFLFHSFHGPDFNFEAGRTFLKAALLNVSFEDNKELLKLILEDEYTPKFKFLKLDEYLVKFSAMESHQQRLEAIVDLILEIYKERYVRLEQLRYFFGIGTGIFIFGTFLWTILTITYLMGPKE